MKKILALILALLLVLGIFASCGGKSSDKDDPDDEYEENEEENEEKETVTGENSESNAENDGNTENGGNTNDGGNSDNSGSSNGGNGGASNTCSQHTAGKATCKSKAICSNCNQSYGELDPDNHAESIVTMQNNKHTHKKMYTCCGVAIEEAHQWTNGICLECNQTYIASTGLEFTKSSDNSSYYVSGIGTCTDTEIFIPYTYNGLPVTSIGSSTFESYSQLTNITILDNVTNIGDYAFKGCTNLTSITIPDSVTSIGFSAFQSCPNLTSITIPFVGATKDGSSNTHFGYIFGASSYSYNDSNVPANLKTVIITGSTSINNYAFYTCYKLTNISIPDSITNIGDSAFEDCYSLKSITIPDSVTNIGYNAFKDCTNLTSIIISDSVISLRKDAFYNTAYYKNESNWENGVLYIENYLIKAKDTIFGSYSIKEGTKVIANSAFSDCDRLESVTIGDSVTRIGDNAFYSCYSLTSITIPDSVTSIGSSAFKYCTSLANVTIGNGVTSIGDNAFYYCDSLTSVTIGNGVTRIGDNAFSSCGSLTSVYYDGDIASWCNITFDDYSANPLFYAENLYMKNSSGNYELVTDIVIPNTVTEIKTCTFKSFSGLVSITIPDSVTRIGDKAFEYCHSLTSVIIGNGVTSIGSRAFDSCTNLTSVTIGNSVTSIGNNAFYFCVKLVEIINKSSLDIKKGDLDGDGHQGFNEHAFYALKVYKEGESEIDKQGNYLFYTDNGINYLLNYVGIETILNLPENYKGENYQIYKYAFYHNENITNVTLPNSVTSIGKYAFHGCTSLTSVTIGNSVTSIGEYAFCNCYSLTNITIGNGVKSIGMRAFEFCSKLTSIKYRGTQGQWNNISKGLYWDDYVPSSCAITYNYTGE